VQWLDKTFRQEFSEERDHKKNSQEMTLMTCNRCQLRIPQGRIKALSSKLAVAVPPTLEKNSRSIQEGPLEEIGLEAIQEGPSEEIGLEATISSYNSHNSRTSNQLLPIFSFLHR